MITLDLHISDIGINVLKDLESFRAFVYDDATGQAIPFGRKPIGNPTIGYGHKLLLSEHYTNGINKVQAESILRTDVLEAEMCVRDWCEANDVPLTQNQFDATVIFIFNCGEAPLKEGFGTLLKEHLYLDAANRMLAWDHTTVNGELVQNAGLKTRREKERELFLSKAA